MVKSSLLSEFSDSDCDRYERSRADILASYGATQAEVQELLAYNNRSYRQDSTAASTSTLTYQAADSKSVNFAFPLSSEPHVSIWEQYLTEAAEQGVFTTLKQRLPQLQFPIGTGISETPSYRAATRQGKSTSALETPGLVVRQPDTLQLWIYPTLVGKIPVLIAGDRQDFVALVQAFTLRNEPKPVPASMGACIVSGFNNWDRIRQYRQNWEQLHPEACSEAHWNLEFQRLIPQKTLYQDRFIILSEGPYSNIPSQHLNLTDEAWHQLSLIIRLEHECTHYLTQRLLGLTNYNILDELVADYRGIVAAVGTYRADWFLSFIGLDSYPTYREGGRLQNYRGQPPLSDGAFKVLQVLVKHAAVNLEKLHLQCAEALDENAQVRWLLTLTQTTLEYLADDSTVQRLKQIFQTTFSGNDRLLNACSEMTNPQQAHLHSPDDSL